MPSADVTRLSSTNFQFRSRVSPRVIAVTAAIAQQLSNTIGVFPLSHRLLLARLAADSLPYANLKSDFD